MKYLLILFMLIVFSGYAQKSSTETLMQDFLTGKLFVVNKFAIMKADTIFFETLIQEEFSQYHYLDAEVGKKQYGTKGEKGVHQIELEMKQSYDTLNLSIVEAYILKNFHQEKKLLYVIDGVPNQNVNLALLGLIDKEIEKVQQLNKNQAKALWGREGESGALLIHTIPDEKLKFE